jgi:hypothetical protein
MRLVRLVSIVLLVGGCGGTRSGGGGPTGKPPIANLSALAVVPPMQTLTIQGAQPAVFAYHAIGTFSDGHTADVTSQVAFSATDGSLGTFQGATFTSNTARGGATAVTASAGNLAASGTLTLILSARVNDGASLPPNPASQFNAGAPAGSPPSLVYPNDGVLVPPNLGLLEFHFLPGAGNTLFELSFASPFTDVKVYLRCSAVGAGCVYQPSAQVWTWLAESNRGGAPVAASLRATDDSGSTIAEAPPVSFSVSEDDIQGGLYYWTTSGATAIMRFDFAGEKTQAEKFIGPEAAGGQCVGCHALSADGHKMVAEAGGQNSGALLLLDVASAMPIVPFASTPKSTFESWDPSGARYVGVYGDAGATDFNLMLFDGATGALTGDIAGTGTATNPADHPDWSADGKRIAYVKVGHAHTLQRMGMGAIEVVQRQAGDAWSAPIEIVPPLTGKNRYYPAFSPDGSFLVFDESTCSPSGENAG